MKLEAPTVFGTPNQWWVLHGINLGATMTGKDLHQLLIEKWGKSYDIRLRRTRGKIFVQVMWKYLEQVSFPMTEADYFEHLDAVANYLNAWGSTEQVKEYIATTRDRPRLGKAVSVALDLGSRASEWLLDEF